MMPMAVPSLSTGSHKTGQDNPCLRGHVFVYQAVPDQKPTFK